MKSIVLVAPSSHVGGVERRQCRRLGRQPRLGLGSNPGSAKLFPFAANASWTYAVSAVGAGSTCAPGTFSQSVLSANPAGGRDAFQLDSFCSALAGTTFDYSTPGGDEVDFLYMGAWATLVDPTLTDGHDWPYINTSYHWHRETGVTVPAGSFDDCWTAVQDVSYTATMTYCRGTGMVRSYSSDLTGAGWDAELASSTL